MTDRETDDEIVAEVRRSRAEFLKSCGGTLEGVLARLKELEAQEAQTLVFYPPRKQVVRGPGWKGWRG
jgi:hypothetical protein